MLMMARSRLKRIATTIASIITVACLGAQPAMAAEALQGIDVSGWQLPSATRTAQADFAIVKATQGLGFENNYLAAQANGALATGKKLGLYHYAGGSSCTAEADFFVRVSRPWIGKAMLVLDWESYQNNSWGSTTWATCFVNRVKATTGVTPMVYVQASALNQVAGARAANAGLWVAQYASNNATGYQSSPWNLGRYGEAMRQYTSNGWVTGYNGPLDLNIFLGSREQWDKYANPSSKPVAQPSTPAVQPQQPSQPANASKTCVTVQAGDSLSAIAARYNSSYTEWAGYKSGNPSVIYPGEVVCKAGGAVSQPATRPQSSSSSASVYYTVVSGDSLSRIAARYGTSWQSIQQLNGIRNASLIYPGQRLLVRRGSTSGYTAPASNSSYYRVRSGDTLSGIAARYGTSWSYLQQLNGIRNASLIYPGQTIRVR